MTLNVGEQAFVIVFEITEVWDMVKLFTVSKSWNRIFPDIVVNIWLVFRRK